MTAFDPSRIFETLDRHGVDYLTIGAGAVIAHGYVRATADIDFVARLDEANMIRLAAALSELDARLRDIDAGKLDIDPTDPKVLANGASFTMDTDAGPLDFLNDVLGADSYDEMRLRARQVNAAGVTVWVVGYSSLMMKTVEEILTESRLGVEPRTHAWRVPHSRCGVDHQGSVPHVGLPLPSRGGPPRIGVFHDGCSTFVRRLPLELSLMCIGSTAQ